MTSPNLNYYAYALVTLKAFSDGSTLTVKLSNRPILDSAADYISILKEIQGLGAELTDYSVSDFTGAIIVRDELGSFGVERKFSDLLQRYTIIDQPIEIFTAITTATDSAPSSWTSKFKGYVSTLTRQQGELAIQVEARIFKRTKVGMRISDGEFPTAPAASIGKTLPVVTGFIPNEVEGLLTEVVSDEEIKVSYCATFSEQYVAGSQPSQIKTKTLSGDWKEVISSTAGTYNYQQSDLAGVYFLSDGAENARHLPSYAAPGIIATGGRLSCHGWNDAGSTVTGFIEIKIYPSMPGGTRPNVAQPIAQAVVSMADYAANFKANLNFYVYFSLDKPLPLTNSETYFFSVSYSQNGSSYPLQLTVSSALYAGTINFAYKTASSDWYYSTTQYNYTCGFLGLTFTHDDWDGYTDENGYGAANFTITQEAAAVGQTVPNLTDLQFVFKSYGLYDDASGTITGIAADPIRRADHIFKLLTSEYEKPDWNPSAKWDFTVFDSLFDALAVDKTDVLAYPKREISGNSSQRDELESLLIDLARNFHARITLRNSGKLALWPWGASGAVAYSIGQDDIRLESLAIGSASTVINTLRLSYEKNLTNVVDSSILRADRIANYGAVYIAELTSSEIVDLLIGQSSTLFGKRRLANETYDFLADSISAEVVGNSLLARWNMPSVFVRISVPLYKYEAIERLDIIEVQTPELPAFYGTAPVQGPTTYDGIERPPSAYDQPRAETYRAQVEGTRINWNDSSSPSLTLTLRLLLNYPKDPT